MHKDIRSEIPALRNIRWNKAVEQGGTGWNILEHPVIYLLFSRPKANKLHDLKHSSVQCGLCNTVSYRNAAPKGHV